MLISWVSDSPCSTVLFGVVAFFLSEQNSAQYVCYGKIMLYLPKLKQNWIQKTNDSISLFMTIDWM